MFEGAVYTTSNQWLQKHAVPSDLQWTLKTTRTTYVNI